MSPSLRRIQAITRKEWAEAWQNRMVLVTVFLVPIIFAGVAIMNLVLMANVPDSGGGEPLPPGIRAACDGLDGLPCMQVYLGGVFHLMFMILPMVIPSTIAAYGVVGEKNSRTLEPLLATPFQTWELLTGKLIAAIVPGMLGTWAAFALWLGAAAAFTPHEVFLALVHPRWLASIAVLAPLLAVLSTAIGLMVSSRSTDPRAAQQVAGLVVLPLLGLTFGQVAGLILVSKTVVAAVCVLVAGLDVAMLALAVQVFEREAILTRWR